VKEKDAEGKISGDSGKVIEIIEHKDILAIPDGEKYLTEYNGKKYSFTKDELINNNEYNSGVFAFKFSPLNDLIYRIESDNAQGEIYVTDLISIFNRNGLNVRAVSPEKQYVLMGFNNKSVLKKMEMIARDLVYDKLKDLVMIEDADDFYIADEVVEQIIEMDKKGIPLDIKIGKGVYIGKDVKLNYNAEIRHGAYLNGNIELGTDVIIWDRAHLSTYPHQKMTLGNKVQIYWDDLVKGRVEIGDGSSIESSVIMTGSDEYPVRVGENAVVKGSTYIFGCVIEEGVHVEHCILIRKRLKREMDNEGNIIPVKFSFPEPEGTEIIEDLN
jgi:bifunctional UDP-N-acetylglucosamine pyrophosphorylase/glucosamine-1-phosphate N-acetyltransferase